MRDKKYKQGRGANTAPPDPLAAAAGVQIITHMLPSRASMELPSPFAQFVRAVATKEFATLYFFQQPVDERGDILAGVREALTHRKPGAESVTVERRVEPVAKVLLPIAVLRDLRGVIDHVIQDIESGSDTETVQVNLKDGGDRV